jgi:hypothetical protein
VTNKTRKRGAVLATLVLLILAMFALGSTDAAQFDQGPPTGNGMIYSSALRGCVEGPGTC